MSTKTNETGEFCNLLAWLDLAGAVVTFDALHKVKAQAAWLTEAKSAHYIAIVKRGQKPLYRPLRDLPWGKMAVAHTASETGHGRSESRSIKTCGIDPALGQLLFPGAVTAIRLHRRQAGGRKRSRTTIYAVTSLDAHQADPADLAALIRGHWTIENRSHLVRDIAFREDACRTRTGSAPRALTAFRNLAAGALRLAGVDNLARTIRHNQQNHCRTLPFIGITT